MIDDVPAEKMGELKKPLAKKTLKELLIFNEESSAFDSEDQLQCVEKLTETRAEFTPHEVKLLFGVLAPH